MPDHIIVQTVETEPANPETRPLKEPVVIEIFEHGAFQRKSFAQVTRNNVPCTVSRSPGGGTIYVEELGNKNRMVALNLRPLLEAMADVLLEQED